MIIKWKPKSLPSAPVMHKLAIAAPQCLFQDTVSQLRQHLRCCRVLAQRICPASASDILPYLSHSFQKHCRLYLRCASHLLQAAAPLQMLINDQVIKQGDEAKSFVSGLFGSMGLGGSKQSADSVSANPLTGTAITAPTAEAPVSASSPHHALTALCADVRTLRLS